MAVCIEKVLYRTIHNYGKALLGNDKEFLRAYGVYLPDNQCPGVHLFKDFTHLVPILRHRIGVLINRPPEIFPLSRALLILFL